MVPSFKYHLHPRESLKKIVVLKPVTNVDRKVTSPEIALTPLSKVLLSPLDVNLEQEDMAMVVKTLPALPNMVAETVRMELDVEDVETVKPEVVVEATVVPNLKVFQVRLKIKLLPKKLKKELRPSKKLRKFSHPSQLRLKSLAFLSMMFLT